MVEKMKQKDITKHFNVLYSKVVRPHSPYVHIVFLQFYFNLVEANLGCPTVTRMYVHRYRDFQKVWKHQTKRTSTCAFNNIDGQIQNEYCLCSYMKCYK